MVTSSPIIAVSGPTQIGLGKKEDGPGHEAGDLMLASWPGVRALDLLGLLANLSWERCPLNGQKFSQGKAAASETHTAPVSPTCLKIILTFMCSCLNYISSLLACLFII